MGEATKLQVDRDKQLVFKDGKLQYSAFVALAAKADRQRFNEAVIALVGHQHPDVLPPAEAAS